ncbi:hypothetical protein Nepgr_020062 [Nepenthes gracilis]|uniref:Uncharacterized protein n=1 Tax=Nepenthes gracilis TaxID=150966 RepID=A0AAD3SWL9_NEPGR|nr:hypothetical protein Nepgr_020062 [Nepenthes gracilis]
MKQAKGSSAVALISVAFAKTVAKLRIASVGKAVAAGEATADSTKAAAFWLYQGTLCQPMIWLSVQILNLSSPWFERIWYAGPSLQLLDRYLRTKSVVTSPLLGCLDVANFPHHFLEAKAMTDYFC